MAFVGKIWAVRRCFLCERIWNRDVNAGRNIREVFLDMLFRSMQRRTRGFEHPGAFSIPDMVPAPPPDDNGPADGPPLPPPPEDGPPPPPNDGGSSGDSGNSSGPHAEDEQWWDDVAAESVDNDDEDDTDDSSSPEMPDETPQEVSMEEGTVMFSYNAAQHAFEYVGPEQLGPMPNICVGSVVTVLYMAEDESDSEHVGTVKQINGQGGTVMVQHEGHQELCEVIVNEAIVSVQPPASSAGAGAGAGVGAGGAGGAGASARPSRRRRRAEQEGSWVYNNDINAFQYSSSAAGLSVPTVQVGSMVTVSLGDGTTSTGKVVRLNQHRNQIVVRFGTRDQVVDIGDVLLPLA